MTAMNPHAAITRDEFERTIEELRAEMKANPSHSTAADRASFEHPREEFVRKDEFRLFKWFGGLALAAILSGMGLLYQSIHQGLAEHREATERQFAEFRAEMHAGFRAITAHVDAGFEGVNSRFDGVNSRFDGVNSRFDNVNSRLTALERDVSDVRERLTRVETLLDVKNRKDLPD